VEAMAKKEYLLRGRSFWTVSTPHNCSWSWRKLLRDIAKPYFKFVVGDGKNIHMSGDNWHPAGILLEKFGYRAIYDAQSSMGANLSAVLLNGDWCWRPARSDALVEI
jgi:hypothetical protein